MTGNIKKIKIIFFIPVLDMGGAPRFFVNLVNNLDREHFDISVLLGQKKGIFLSEISPDIKVLSFGILHMRYSLFGLLRYFKNEKPDIFVSFFPHLNLISIISKILSGTKTKIVISERSTFSKLSKHWSRNFFQKISFGFIYPFCAKLFYPKADKIICVSRGVANDLTNTLGDLKNLAVVYNFFDFEKIITLSKQDVGYHQIYNDIPVICAVGSLTREKDYPTLLGAFFLVLKEKKSSLVIIGEGSERKKLESLAKNLSISSFVHFMGIQENPYKFMAKSQVFVLSSVLEGLPNVIVEAMTCGTPVVSTDCESGPNEIIKNEENGFLVPVADKAKLAEAILNLLKDKELREKFSVKAKKMVYEKFSPQKTIKEYERIFKEIYG